jgi:hypothetical protein
MPFRASRLQRDGYLLRRARVDAARLKPDDVRIGAELLRQLIAIPEAGKHRDAAIEEWQAFKEAKGV